MLVKVAQMFESGRPLPKHRSVTQQPVHVGMLIMTDQHDNEFRRAVFTAYLRNVHDGHDALPPLRDAVVRWIGDYCITISGFETIEPEHKCVAQSWYAQIVRDTADDEPPAKAR